MNYDEYINLMDKIRRDRDIAKTVEELGGFSTRVVISDKLGYDWEELYLGDSLLRQTYIPQANPVGTADNPIEYYDGCSLINNAYYIKDGVRQVYMNGLWAEF